MPKNKTCTWYHRPSKNFHIFNILSFIFFLSTKLEHYFIIQRKNSSYLQKTFILSKTEKITFPQNSFSRNINQIRFHYPFHSLSSKIFRKFKFVLYGQIVQKVQKVQRVQGVQGVQVIFPFFHYHFLFLWKCIYVQNISFHYHFYYFPYLWKCIYNSKVQRHLLRDLLRYFDDTLVRGFKPSYSVRNSPRNFRGF